MIRKCDERDFDEILTVINDGAQAYSGVIPKDRWKEPYMSASELKHEIADGVVFSGWDENGRLLGVMGIQEVEDVCLIRHACVRTSDRNHGIGSRLLRHFMEATRNPILTGTWADASWQSAFTKSTALGWSVPNRRTSSSTGIGRFRRGRLKPPSCWWIRGPNLRKA
jgi:N-acetylglutamate synthase-like GNAT family acetyltransferase